jgi:hypothetical protein
MVHGIPRPADPDWKPSPDAELAHLRLTWGRSYQIDHDPQSGQWVARFYGSGRQMITGSPLGLRTLIRDDWNGRQPRSGWSSL